MDIWQQLSREQSQEFHRVKTLLSPDDKTQQLCLTYYLSYKQQTPSLSIDKIPIAWRCAYLMAEKSQHIYNMKGQKVRGIGLSLNQLLKCHKLDDIMMMLKQFCKKVRIADEEAEGDLVNIVKEISFLITFHGKFQKVIQQLEVKQKVGQSFGYSKIFTSFIWLLYIQAKNQLLHRSLDLIENTCMLAHTIAFMLIYSWDYIRPMSLLKGDRKLNEDSTWKEVSYLVKERVLDMFKIKDMDSYRLIAKSFEELFQNMADGGVIKVSNGKRDFFGPQLINTNYKRLDHFYQKALNPQDLDQRIFFKDRATNLTPSKFTPFSRQGYANKLTKPSKMATNDKENFTSHRILTYDLMDKQQTAQKIMPISQMKLPKSVIQTPSSVKVPLICSTPITTGMEMYNYLSQKVRRISDKPIHSNVDVILTTIFDKDRKQLENNTKNLKKGLIISFHRYLIESYLHSNPHQNVDSIWKAFLGMSIELVFFVSNISISLEQIDRQLNPNILEQWKACQYLLKFDKSMPSTLKLRILDIEVNIISYRIWKNPTLMEQLLMCANSEETTNDPIQRCFRRVLHQVAYQISQLCQSLKVNEKISESIFQTMKEVIISNIDLLSNRHIDQLIICCIYSNCKLTQMDVKFNQIKQKYLELNQHNKEFHEEIMCKVYVEDQPSIDIIKFYNNFFIHKMKSFMAILKESNTNISHNRKNSILQSPLKNIIPKQLNMRGNKLTKNINTPQTHLLYAYNESPMLKQQYHLRPPNQAKKIINFEEEQQNLGKKLADFDKQSEAIHLQNALTNDYINRKQKINREEQQQQQLLTTSQSTLLVNCYPPESDTHTSLSTTKLLSTRKHQKSTNILTQNFLSKMPTSLNSNYEWQSKQILIQLNSKCPLYQITINHNNQQNYGQQCI